jgi:pimeloyl-ACP methyl ester carboxylesterase
MIWLLLLMVSLRPWLLATAAVDGAGAGAMIWEDRCATPENPRLASLVAEARCGNLSVAEDPNQPQGRHIQLAVMVLPAIAQVALADPIFLLAGGPGQSAIDSGPGVFSALRELRHQRDVVLVDQRGTGASNNLSCPRQHKREVFDKATRHQIDEEIEYLKACLAGLDADPTLYTTGIAMQDLDLVRSALGYELINVLGISYGTRAALVYARQSGEHLRAMILDGVAPPTMTMTAQFAADADAALDRLFADCVEAVACQQAFPDLAEHFVEILNRLAAAPEAFRLRHPRTGQMVTAVIDRPLVTQLVRQVLYQRTLSILLPLAIEQAYAGDYQTLMTLGYQFYEESDSMSVGMMASVLCAEDMTRPVIDAADGRYFSQTSDDFLKEVCQFWPTQKVSDDYFEPVSSDVPTLLLSGELDPVTPPKYAEQALLTLAQARHLVVPGVGHNAVFIGCVPDLLKRFITGLVPDALDVSCLADIRRPPFFTSSAGPGQQVTVDD